MVLDQHGRTSRLGEMCDAVGSVAFDDKGALPNVRTPWALSATIVCLKMPTSAVRDRRRISGFRLRMLAIRTPCHCLTPCTGLTGDD
jgi:hypothetical protein